MIPTSYINFCSGRVHKGRGVAHETYGLDLEGRD